MACLLKEYRKSGLLCVNEFEKNDNIEYIFKKQKHFTNHLKISHAYLTLFLKKETLL